MSSSISEDTLQLNLTTSIESKEKKRKLDQESSPTATEGNEEVENVLPVKPKKKKMKKDGAETQQQQGEEFISSLFNNNPEIPKLDLSLADKSKKEQVFPNSHKNLVESGVHPYIAQTLNNLDMKTLTLVQSLSLPLVSAGFDCLIKSQTGSGKTLAYAVPLVQKLAEIRPKIDRSQGTFAIIICPTRELVVQSYEWFQKLCYSFKWLVPGMLIGGEKRKSEKARVRKGITILIATPGRLVDHISHTKSLSLKSIQWLVLDECDRMLELGYKRDVQAVLNALEEQNNEKRQTVLLSATLTQGIEEMSSISLKHPKFIDAAVDSNQDEEVQVESLTTLTTPDNLQQTFVIVPAKLRLIILAGFLLWKCRFSKPRKLLIFMNTQDMIDFHRDLFEHVLNGVEKEADDESGGQGSQRPLRLLKLHGSMEQKERLSILGEVKKSTDCVLFCTDVAARGLDLPQVDWIVQYNPPTTTADYVHRVGRTARIGAKGSSLIFTLPSEANFIKELEDSNMNMLQLKAERVLEKLHANAEVSVKTGRYPSTMEEAATDLQMKFETAISNDTVLHQSASQAYVSYVRSYASYPRDVRHIFSFKALHLGHIAKSFGLRDPPSQITGIGKGHWVKKEAQRKNDLRREQKVIKAQEKRINQKALVISEFSSGLDGITDTASVKKSSTKKKGKK